MDRIEENAVYLSCKDNFEIFIYTFLLLLFFAVIYCLVLDNDILAWIGAIGGFLAALVSLLTYIFALKQVKEWKESKLNDLKLNLIVDMYVSLESLPNIFKNYVYHHSKLNIQEDKFDLENSQLNKNIAILLENTARKAEDMTWNTFNEFLNSYEKYHSISKLLKAVPESHTTRGHLERLSDKISAVVIDDVEEKSAKPLSEEEDYHSLLIWVKEQKNQLKI